MDGRAADAQDRLRADDDVSRLPGITPNRRSAFARMGVNTLEDLLRFAPRRHDDRRHPTPIRDLEAGVTVLVIGTVEHSKSFRARRGMTILEATVGDGTASVCARWFQRGYLPNPLPTGCRVALWGTAKKRGNDVELASPELERLPDEASDDDSGVGASASGRWVPVHPATTGLTAPVIRRAVWSALSVAGDVEDAVPPALLAAQSLPPLGPALRALHFPDDPGAAEEARCRLAFDELLVHELQIARRRRAHRTHSALACAFSERVHERIRARLPFELTSGQQRAVDDIVADLQCDAPMNRLLQGDVGSGKTAVAAYALLGAVASGMQAVFMAPTEVLAQQHERTLDGLLEGSRVRIELLTGSRAGKERREAEQRIARGEVDLVLGTHAVLKADLEFHRLGFVVVDEQHKFGVRQRRDLVEKGFRGEDGSHKPHCLVMTATPIPRTLAMTVYGELDVSIIEGRLPGRVPVDTWVTKPKEGRKVLARVKAALENGNQAYVIYPLVEESDKVALRDAEAGHARWTRALPGRRVGLLHGRMKRDDKDAVMSAFRAGEIDLLVSTVVIEVGVDVPNATVLIVEHAERFGLSQLHQLRGRIGRGTEGGLCVLIDRARAATPARLDVLAATEDGFEIAEEDLKLRGVGDLFGTRQHGRPGFRAAQLPRDLPLLVRARDAARALMDADPALADRSCRVLRRRVSLAEQALEDPSKGG